MLLLIDDLVAIPGKRGELAEHVHALLGGGAEGLMQFTVGFSESDPDALTIVHEWRDAASLAAFEDSEFFAGFREATEALHAAPPASRRFTIDVPAPPETPIISLL